MNLITDGKINTEVALSIVWKLLVAAVLWYFNGAIKDDEKFREDTQRQIQATKDRTLVLEERTRQQRTEIDALTLENRDMRDLFSSGEVVPLRRPE